MPRNLTLRKRKDFKGGSLSTKSNVEKLSEQFLSKMSFGKSQDSRMSAAKIQKKFSI